MSKRSQTPLPTAKGSPPGLNQIPVPRQAWLGCFRRKECWAPTRRGFFLLLSLLVGLGIAGLLGIHPFLAPTQSIAKGILVVEGWGPDYAMKSSVEEFNRGQYSKLYVTGGPLEWGAPLSEYKSYAELGAAILTKMGLNTNQVEPVPAPLVQQDRTYNSALALKKRLDESRISHPTINLISIGPHARRSRLLFEKAFGKGTAIGIIALQPRDYNPRRWWRSSQGVRTVLSETIAYAYVRILFRPKTEQLQP